MSDLLKEAIADAKAVRETALQNAKMALEEAFTPQLQSMLSAKLREDDDYEEDEEDEFPAEEDEFSAEEQDDEVPVEEPVDDEVPVEEPFDDEVPAEEQEDEFEEDEHEDELDLEAIIRELEQEVDDDEDLEEQDDAYDQNVENKKNPGLHEQEDDEDEDENEEDVYKENRKLKGTMREYKRAVHFLKDKLHEVNILNAKLLFTNKLFKEFVLTNEQKLKIVETFDRAQTTREIKLIYTTIAENHKNGNVSRKFNLKESASKKSGSTRPSKASRKVITEENQVADRFKKLAGLIK